MGKDELSGMAIEVEKLKSQIKALMELRESWEERFNIFSEKIGELRSMFIEHEKEYRENMAKVQKFTEIMESVRPEQYLTLIQKQNIKIDSLEAKIISYQALVDKISEQIRDIYRTLAKFKGIEEVLEMAKKMRKDLVYLNKMKVDIESKAEQVNGLYLKMSSKMDLIESLDEQIKEMSKILSDLVKTVSSIKTQLPEKMNKRDLKNVLSDIEKIRSEMQDMLSKVQTSRKEIEKILTSNEKVAKLASSVELELKEIEVLKQKMRLYEELDKSVRSLATKVDSLSATLTYLRGIVDSMVSVSDFEALKTDVSLFMKNVEERFSSLETKISSITSDIENIVKTQERIDKTFKKLSKELSEMKKLRRDMEDMYVRVENQLKKIASVFDAVVK